MTKKRRIPSGKIPDGARQQGRTIENELLAHLLDHGGAPVAWLMNRHPDLTQAQAEAHLELCRAAMEEGFALVAAAMGTNATLPAVGQLAQAHPWIDGRNLDEIHRLGLFYGK